MNANGLNALFDFTFVVTIVVVVCPTASRAIRKDPATGVGAHGALNVKAFDVATVFAKQLHEIAAQMFGRLFYSRLLMHLTQRSVHQ